MRAERPAGIAADKIVEQNRHCAFTKFGCLLRRLPF
jgi:hypothetical protein